ncbi:hypothetical protein RRG08_026648 [Elysia crispata]|uniref:3-hydroxyanthranilate 3,4-dioxygenase n=1 Tax=Elysia crispata TaxID=231223 RepID=A0AAE1B0S3_9GAST|nr:hypothetical protein RRG08_026648 [Elysia crispata]
MSEKEPIIYNTEKWIAENEKYFLPPVCNKMMHKEGQMKVFYVGGPNVRKDYHIEEGEELFYMLKGDMCLKVVEHGKHRDVPIKEGEIFLLPACVAHSPQRNADTIGLVVERERDVKELDGLRYFVEKDGLPTTESLYEAWFHCEDLGTQLGPIINQFFASEQYKTGQPIPGTIPESPPVSLDGEVSLQMPFNFQAWINQNRSDLDNSFVQLFPPTFQFDVKVYGKGTNSEGCCGFEIWIWQIEGTSSVTVDGKDYRLEPKDTMLILDGQKYTATRPAGSVALICHQDPARKKKV